MPENVEQRLDRLQSQGHIASVFARKRIKEEMEAAIEEHVAALRDSAGTLSSLAAGLKASYRRGLGWKLPDLTSLSSNTSARVYMPLDMWIKSMAEKDERRRELEADMKRASKILRAYAKAAKTPRPLRLRIQRFLNGNNPLKIISQKDGRA